MKQRYFLIFLLLSNFLFSQEKNHDIYDEAITIIKNSGKMKEFSKNNNVSDIKFKIDNRLFSICEWYSLYKEETNGKLIKYCHDTDWIDDLLDTEVSKNATLNKKSDKGKSTFNLIFSNTIENYFTAEVQLKNDNNSFAIFLFLIKNDQLYLIKEDIGQRN